MCRYFVITFNGESMKKLLLLLAVAGSTLCCESSQEQSLDHALDSKITFSTGNDVVLTGSHDGSITVWGIKGNKLYSLSNNNDMILYLIKKQKVQRSIIQEGLKTFGARFNAEMQG